MPRFCCPTLLFLLAILAGCATRGSLPAAPVSPPPPVTAAPPAAAREPYFTQTGMASFYGAAHDGRTRADGGTFDRHDFTAAHRTLAFGTVVRVTNLDNGRSIKVEINDRGPHVKGRIIDLSSAAARALGMTHDGVTRVRVEAFRQDQSGAG
jgi:rare lipoprotein A